MLKKLKTLFPNSIYTNQKPEDYFSRYHWFTNNTDEWIGIPRNEVLDHQLELLKSLFDYYHTAVDTFHTSTLAQSWYLFLFENGPIPPIEMNVNYRLIYFQMNSGNINIADFEAALQAFFDSNITIVWENERKGIIIEPKSRHSMSENEFRAMNDTLKSDFFIEPQIYIGKFRSVSVNFLDLIRLEKSLLDFAHQSFKQDKIFYFEKLAPRHLAYHLPEEIKPLIIQDILPIFNDDHELFLTIKNFLQNNMNASNTAKHLYIHRNTLQYRLDKFAEKTGIPLKDFNSALTVYIACILFEHE